MPPKASASSGTRKKHARKAAAALEKQRADDEYADLLASGSPLPEPQREQSPAVQEPPADKLAHKKKQQKTVKRQRGEKKKKKLTREEKANRKKVYVPPPKPPRGQVDPVDLYNLGVAGSLVDPERVVILRRIAKKDSTTVERALDDFAAWIASICTQDQADEMAEILPAWVHHYPRLSSHSSRRVRLLTSSITSTLAIEGRQTLVTTIQPLLIDPIYLEREDYIGSLLLSAFDVDRQISKTSLNTLTTLASGEHSFALPTYLPEFTAFLPTIIFASAPSGPEGEIDPDEQDRLANQQVSAIDALAWLSANLSTPETADKFQSILHLDDLWNLLQSGSVPTVRRAVWRLVATLISSPNADGLLSDILPIMGFKSFTSVLSERDYVTQVTAWAAFVPFIKKYPQSWLLTKDGADSSSGSDSDDEIEPTHRVSFWRLYIDYLKTGCCGNPVAGYDHCIATLETPPQSVFERDLNSAKEVLDAFHSAVHARAVFAGGIPAISACIRTYTTLLSWFVARPSHESTSQSEYEAEDLLALVKAHFLKLWTIHFGLDAKEVTATTKRNPFAGPAVSDQLLTAFINIERATPGFGLLCEQTLIDDVHQYVTIQQDCLDTLYHALSSLYTNPTELATLKTTSTNLIVAAASRTIQQLSHADEQGVKVLLPFLEKLVKMKHTPLLKHPHTQLVEAFLTKSLTSSTLADTPAILSLFRIYLHQNTTYAQIHTIIETYVGQLKSQFETSFSSRWPVHQLATIISELRSVPYFSDIEHLDFDAVALQLASSALHDEVSVSNEVYNVLAKLLARPEPFIQSRTASDIISMAFQMENPVACTRLLSAYFDNVSNTDHVEIPQSSQLFKLARGSDSHAQTAWTSYAVKLGTAGRQAIVESILEELATELLDSEATSSPFDVIEACRSLSSLAEESAAALQRRVLPPLATLDRLSRSAVKQQVASSLAVQDPLVVPTEEDDPPSPSSDTFTLSTYEKSVIAWIHALSEDHTIAKTKPSLLTHILLLHLRASDTATLIADLAAGREWRNIADITDRVIAFFVSSLARGIDLGWHQQAVNSLRSGKANVDKSSLLAVTTEIYNEALSDSNTFARILSKLLATICKQSDAGPPEAEQWLGLAMAVQSKSFDTCLAIIGIVKEHLGDNVRFNRYQNELAASLAGVAPSAAAFKGVPLLRLLLGTAPPLDSVHSFLPVQRSVFLLQALQKWILDENDDAEDLEDSTQAYIVELCTYLAPVLQGMSGAHWQFMLDLVDYNIEVSDWSQPSTLINMSTSVNLVVELKHLISTNKELRSLLQPLLKEPESALIKAYFDSISMMNLDGPSRQVQASLLSLVKLQQKKTFSKSKHFPQLLQLLSDSHIATRMTAFTLLKSVIRPYTENLVLDMLAGPSTADASDAAPKVAELPSELLAMIAASSSASSVEEQITILLQWLVLFEFFEDASQLVKSQYIDQLRRSDVIGTTFLPFTLGILDVTERTRPFDIQPWGVDEFLLDQLESDHIEDHLPLLSAFVLYRGLQVVPSLIRAHWESIKSRQLSAAISTFISRNFSPVLIANELEHLKEGSTISSEGGRREQLRDENMSVKVSPNVGEVRATYIVDEQPMEIAIRIPSDFPLAGVEVKDVQKIGVTDSVWRAWLLNVQLVITSQNGLIADALALFKRNVSLHFEGVEACAICYSVISVTDRSLPTKKCRTCKNLFHSTCLYKWFSTSHSSSCPMCRSLFGTAS